MSSAHLEVMATSNIMICARADSMAASGISEMIITELHIIIATTAHKVRASHRKIATTSSNMEDKRPEKMPPPPVYSQAEILATLERLGSTDGIS